MSSKQEGVELTTISSNQNDEAVVEVDDKHATIKDDDCESVASVDDEIYDQFGDNHRVIFFWVVIILQLVLGCLYGGFLRYGKSAVNPVGYSKSSKASMTNMDEYYPLYQDVHVMIFIGFGFLMTFLQKYGFSSVGYNFLISAFTVQWALVMNGIWHGAFEGFPEHCHNENFNYTAADLGIIQKDDHDFFCIELDIKNLITADFAAGAVMITFGAVLGKTTPLQMLIISVLEILWYGLNENIGAGVLGAVDMGGSIFVHTFGAYFGLAVSMVISNGRDPNKPKELADHPKNGSIYSSDMFAMIGTIFLWMFWPSFNGALAPPVQQDRVIINTVIALTGSCVGAFMLDVVLRPDRKFDMVSIQNATLAGGVAVGSSSDLVIQPWGALVIGVIAGCLSVIGYIYIQPGLAKCCGLDDTCGVHNLHGMPGIMGAIGGIISAGVAGEIAYGNSISEVFENRRCGVNAAGVVGKCYTAAEQAGIQTGALGITLGLAIIGGVTTGFIIKLPFLLPPSKDDDDSCACGKGLDTRFWYDDKYYWEVPEKSDEHLNLLKEENCIPLDNPINEELDEVNDATVPEQTTESESNETANQSTTEDNFTTI